MKILIALGLLVLLSLLRYKLRDGFTDPYDSLNKANDFINKEIEETTDPEKRQKLVNANNYIYFIKTKFN
jgi:hypothetical protein